MYPHLDFQKGGYYQLQDHESQLTDLLSQSNTADLHLMPVA